MEYEYNYVEVFFTIFPIYTWTWGISATVPFPWKYRRVLGEAWTISTLLLWYLVFPWVLPKLQRLTNKEISHEIVKQFWISIGMVVISIYYIRRVSSHESYT